MSEFEQTLSDNLHEIKSFLEHIQGRVGEGAFDRIYAVTEEAIKQNDLMEKLISSDSVYRLLRYGVKNPSSSGVDECEQERYYDDLYLLSCELRKKLNP